MSTKQQMRGLVVAVAGAGPGNCAAVAGAMATRGAYVAIGDPDYGWATETASAINHTVTPGGGGIAIALGLDVRDPESFRLFAQETGNDFGPVDVLVNDSMEGARAALQFVVPEMVQRGSGQIINVASQTTFTELPTLTDEARRRFAGSGVAFTSVLPRLTPPAEPELVAEAVVHAVRSRPDSWHVPGKVGPIASACEALPPSLRRRIHRARSAR